MTTYTESDFDGDHAWLTARYAAALDRVGGNKADHLDPITIFMFGATWGRGHAEQHPRHLTPDDITDEMVERARRAYAVTRHAWAEEDAWEHILTAALTEPPRPEEKVERVLHRYWSGDINGDDLADRIVEEMNR